MKLELEWTRPISLRKARQEANLIYTLDHTKLPHAPGVYVFGRRFGRNLEALYVGKANRLDGRVKRQLQSVPLMLHLKNVKIGKRVVFIGRFRPKPGQSEEKCLPPLERALIRFFLPEGHDLVNKQGRRLRRHEVTSTKPRRLVPPLMFVDR